MKKIAFISNTSWSIYNFRLGVMKALRDAGYEVIVIAPQDEYSEVIKTKGFDYYDITIDNRGTNPLNDIKTIIYLYKLFKKLDIDLAFNFTIKPCIYGSIAAKLSKIKSISVITGLGYVFINKGFLQNIVKQLYKISLNFNSQIWFLNKDDKDLFNNLSITSTFFDINVLPSSGIDTNKFIDKKVFILKGEGIDTESFSNKKINDSDNNLKFLLIARMLWDKGVGEYIEAARIINKKYPKVSFQLLGSLGVNNPSAISEEQMKLWVNEGIIEYLGVSDNVLEIIQSVSCVILPSYREGVPRVLLEAASIEKPIITTDTAGCREVVDDGINGFLCEVKNSKDLADKMEKMINLSLEQRIAMGKDDKRV